MQVIHCRCIPLCFGNDRIFTRMPQRQVGYEFGIVEKIIHLEPNILVDSHKHLNK